MASIKKDIASRVSAAIEDTVEAEGVELLEVKYLKEDKRWILRIVIDKRGGINLEDCERVSRAIDPIIDESVDISQAYYLEVESPGIDRPLKTAADFTRYIGSDIEISFYRAIDGAKKVEGVLKAHDENSLAIEINDEDYTYELSDIANVKRVIVF